MRVMMHQQSIPIPPSGEIFIDHIEGDLQVKGWDRSDVLIRSANKEDLSIVDENEGLRIDCRDDCNLCLPTAANIRVGQVGGNARFKFLDNHLQINHINGSAVLHKVSEVQLNIVEGDLMANKIAGNMVIDQIHGDVFINRLEKGCAIQKVSGSLHLSDINGDIYASAEGDATLRQTHAIQTGFNINSQGDIHCQLPKGVNAQVSFKSEAKSIQVQLSNENNLYETHEKQIILGEGKEQLKLSAKGKIVFSCRDLSWQNVGDFEEVFDNDILEISKSYIQQMEAQFVKQMDLLNDHMEKITETINEASLPNAEVERMVERARQSSVIAAQRAQDKMQRAQIKLEQKLAAARRKLEAKAGRHSHDHAGIHIQWDLKSKTPPPADEQVTQDERLIILRMLEQKKISLQEAENLLRTLEGEEG